MSENEPFDDEIKNFEGELIEFLLSAPLFGFQKSIYYTIKAYFITRKNLTQDMIHKLTGFSRGKISQELKKLVENAFIEKSKISRTGEITYSMDSPKKAIIKNFFNSQKEIFDFYNELNELKKEMNAEKNEIENLYGYTDVYELLTLLTASLPLTMKVIEVLEKELASLEK